MEGNIDVLTYDSLSYIVYFGGLRGLSQYVEHLFQRGLGLHQCLLCGPQWWEVAEISI